MGNNQSVFKTTIIFPIGERDNVSISFKEYVVLENNPGRMSIEDNSGVVSSLYENEWGIINSRMGIYNSENEEVLFLSDFTDRTELLLALMHLGDNDREVRISVWENYKLIHREIASVIQLKFIDEIISAKRDFD